MSGIFREACVELSQAAFDTAKALVKEVAENIVAEANTRAQIEMIHAAESRRQERHRAILRLIDIFCQDLGMRLTRIERAADRDEMYVRVMQACGHPGLYVLDEMRLVMHGSPADTFDYIRSVLENDIPRRKCSCVRRKVAL